MSFTYHKSCYTCQSERCDKIFTILHQTCQEMSSKLDNLATVMNLYSHGTFAKDCFQWTKCVIKYLYDVYTNMNESLIAFLIEVSCSHTSGKIDICCSFPIILWTVVWLLSTFRPLTVWFIHLHRYTVICIRFWNEVQRITRAVF